MTIFGVIGALCLGVSLTACSGGVADHEGAPGSDSGDLETAGESPQTLTADVLGTWASDEKGNPQLVFEDDDTVTGTDGCNRIATSYSIEGDRVLLKEFASTMRACQGVDDWLRSVREVAVAGDTLQVFNNKGVEIGTLKRDA